MGFFDKFTRTINEWEDLRFGDVGGQLGGAWRGLARAFGPQESDAALMAEGIDPDDMSIWDVAGRRVSGFAHSLGGVVGAAAEVPVLRQAFGLLEATYDEFVRRPVATLALVEADMLNGASSPFNADTWQRAYNTTNYVTPGQALTNLYITEAHTALGAVGLEPFDLEQMTEQEQRDFFRDYGGLAAALQDDPGKFDPRIRDGGRRQYYESPYLKTMSGTLDAGLVMVADPALVAIPATRAAVVSVTKRPLDAAAIQSGKLEAYLDRNSYRNLKDYVGQLATDPKGTSEQLRRRVLNNHYNGDLAAALLFDAAKFGPQYRQLGGKIDVFDTTFRALYGDEPAWRTLTTEAAAFADAIGSAKSAPHRMNAGSNYGLGDMQLDAQWDSIVDTKFEAWLDAIVSRRGRWGALHESSKFGLLTETSRTRPAGTPRLTATSQWRVGVHEWLRNRPAARLGHWARRSRMLLPSQRSGRMLDLNDRNSVGSFRATLGMSRLEQHELDSWVSAYARATTPEGRFSVYMAAENAAVGKAMSRYGLDERDLNNLMPVLNRFRSTNRGIFNRNRMFMSTSVQRAIERAKAEGKFARAEELAAQQADITRAVERGDLPGAFYTVPDPDGILTLVPEDSITTLGEPLMITQHADMVPMVDFNVLENALWWNTGGGSKGSLRERAGQGIYYAQDLSRALLDAANTVWKASAILRPGYVWRTLSDEVLRAYGVQGSARFYATAGTGTRNALANMRARGRLFREVMGRQFARRNATDQGTIKVQGGLVATGKGDSRTVPAGFSHNSLSAPGYDEAFAQGIIDSEDFFSRVEAHGTAGTLPEDLYTVFDAHRNGAITRREFRNTVINYVMRRENRGAFTNPSWQQALIEGVVRTAERTREEYIPRASAVDPFTGTHIEGLTDEVLRRDWRPFNARHVTQDGDGYYRVDDVYDFVVDHLDDLMHPDALLGAHVSADGRLALAVYRNVLGKGQDYKPTPDKRVKMPRMGKGELYQDSGTAMLEIETPGGSTRLRGGFMGDEGDRFRKQAGSRGPRDGVIDAITELEYARQNLFADRWEDVSSGAGRRYDEAWERAVNAQLANDPIAKQFLRGKSDREVMDWLFNSNEGRAYQAQMGDLWRAHYAERVLAIQMMVDTYVPVVPGRLAESKVLRAKAATGQATIKDFEALVPRHEMPLVHGASLDATLNRGPIMERVTRLMDKTWKWMSTVPHDKFVRYPFAAQRYDMHARELAQMQGFNDLRVNKLVHEDELRALEAEARSRALADVHQYMFFTNGGPDLARSARFLSPFGSSLSDSLLKHGIALRVNPERYWQIYKAWNAPEQAGLITDDDGNHLQMVDGEEVWFSEDPATGELERIENYEGSGRYITFRLPSWLAPDSFEGSKSIVRINKKIFQTALDLPTFGPLVGLPANQFALDHPEFAENRFVERFILPFGPTADAEHVLIPTNVRNQYRQFFQEDKDFAEAQMTAIFAADMTDYSLGLRPQPPTFEEAREKASDLRGLRWLATFMGVSPQFQSPYQPYVDYYRQLRLQESELRRQAVAEGRELGEVDSADELFLREMGPEYFRLTASVTRNVLGVPPTIQGEKARKRYQDLIERHPEIASLIIGAEGTGAFNQSVYEAQQLVESRTGSGEPLRVRLSPEESWEEVERRRGWVEYGKMMDLVQVYMNRLGVHSLDVEAAAPIRRARDAWLQSKALTFTPWGQLALSPWFRDFRTVDTSRMSQRLMSMREVIQDERLQGRDDIRGLIQYLQVRNQFKAYMAVNGFATVDSMEATPIRLEWERVVNAMKSQNLSFAALYDRWLHADNLQVD